MQRGIFGGMMAFLEIQNRQSSIVNRPRRLRATPALRAMVRETREKLRPSVVILGHTVRR